MARPRSDIEPRIIVAARARFLAQGVDGASLREIAREAGTNIGMVVYYFPTKDHLFLSVVEDVYKNIVGDLEQLLRSDGSARDQLRRSFVRLGNASDLELEVLRLILREALGSSTRLRRVLTRFMKGHVPLIIETIQRGVRNGEFDRKIPIPILFLTVLGLGALPQVFRRAARSLPLFSSLPDAETLAELSTELLSRAVGAGDANGRGPRRKGSKPPPK